MVGLVLGISLQFVRAWTEPTVAPPGGNVGAPINTSIVEQLKLGALGINGLLKLYGGLQVPAGIISGTPKPGYVLTAQKDPADLTGATSNGTAAWAPGGGGGGGAYLGLTDDAYSLTQASLGPNFTASECVKKFGSAAHMCSAQELLTLPGPSNTTYGFLIIGPVSNNAGVCGSWAVIDPYNCGGMSYYNCPEFNRGNFYCNSGGQTFCCNWLVPPSSSSALSKGRSSDGDVKPATSPLPLNCCM